MDNRRQALQTEPEMDNGKCVILKEQSPSCYVESSACLWLKSR